jgi:NADH dehydrogenase [ubiquinone] 1 alpha subcomplex assembly factor 7
MNQARNIGKLIGTNGGGCGLVVDYGADKSFGDSLRVCFSQTLTSDVLTGDRSQAFKEHKIVDIFFRPGECDITANVDFALLKESMADLGMLDGVLLHNC